MLLENSTIEDQELFTYNVASGDMRFIEIAKRALFMRYDPAVGQLLRGEVPDSGPECHINLSHVLLEYVMGCEDCRHADMTAVAADRFGRRIGREFTDAFAKTRLETSPEEMLAEATNIILNSLGASYVVDKKSDGRLRFDLPFCPLHASAEREGLGLWVALAHRALFAFLEDVVQGLAPAWTLEWPAERETEAPLTEIRFAKA